MARGLAHVDELGRVCMTEVVGAERLGKSGRDQGRSNDVVAEELAVQGLALDTDEDENAP